MVNQLAISVIAVFSVLVVVAIGRAAEADRFERELRLITLDEEDRLRGGGPEPTGR
jgi:hypothetical protein